METDGRGPAYLDMNMFGLFDTGVFDVHNLPFLHRGLSDACEYRQN